MILGNRLFAVAMLVLAGGYLWVAANLRTMAISDPVGPKAFPTLVGIGLALAAAALLLETLRSPAAGADDVAKSGEAPRSHYPLAVGAVLLWGTLYAVAFDRIGFIAACTIFLLGLTNFFNRGRWLMNALVSVAVPLAIFYAFTRGLGVFLPRGLVHF